MGPKIMIKFKKFWSLAGPGITTGASDDDPSGIATYSQTGAQFGYGQLWTALYMLPFLVAVQEVCARVGATTEKGIAAIIKENYSQKIFYPIIFLLLIANTINLGADIGAMSAAAQLLIPINFVILLLFFTAIILMLQIFTSYKTYAKILKWFCISILSYPISVFLVKEPWGVILKASVVPNIEFNFKYLFIIMAVFGTTISPYLFFWQASQVCEQIKEIKRDPDTKMPSKHRFLKIIRIDNFIGMLTSEIATWSIIVVCGSVLHQHGITDIKTSADAARALEPLVQSFPNAGYLAKLIFSIGIISLGLLAVPILSTSVAYAFGEAFNWRIGLNAKLKRAPAFYSVIILATLVGLLINFWFDPIKALIYSAVINGVISVPLLILIFLIAKNKKIMGNLKSGFLSNTFLLLTIFFMLAALIIMFITF